MTVSSERVLKSFERLGVFTKRVTKSFERMDVFIKRVTKSFERLDVSTERVSKPFERLDVSTERVSKPFKRMQIFSNRCKFFSNGLQTACKRNSVRKRKVVSVRFPVKGHKCILSGFYRCAFAAVIKLIS